MKADSPLRSLPRVFLPGMSMEGRFDLPASEADKLRKVLRLSTGDVFAALPDDGSLWVCRLDGKSAIPEAQHWPQTEPVLSLTIAQALPKGDRLETLLRMGTEIGVQRFLLFPAERSVVQWDAAKLGSKLLRLRAILRESAEQCFRSRLPSLELKSGLADILAEEPDAIVLSELEGLESNLFHAATARFEAGRSALTLVVGPEGGWSPRELSQIGGRGVTMGPLVLRTDTAGPAAAAAVLFGAYAAFCRNSPSK